MPCEAKPEYYIPDPDGHSRYFQRSGTSERGNSDYSEGRADDCCTGYLPHWSYCSGADAIRYGRAKKKADEAAAKALRMRIAKEREAEAIKALKAERKAEEERIRREAEAAQLRLF